MALWRALSVNERVAHLNAVPRCSECCGNVRSRHNHYSVFLRPEALRSAAARVVSLPAEKKSQAEDLYLGTGSLRQSNLHIGGRECP